MASRFSSRALANGQGMDDQCRAVLRERGVEAFDSGELRVELLPHDEWNRLTVNDGVYAKIVSRANVPPLKLGSRVHLFTLSLCQSTYSLRYHGTIAELNARHFSSRCAAGSSVLNRAKAVGGDSLYLVPPLGGVPTALKSADSHSLNLDVGEVVLDGGRHVRAGTTPSGAVDTAASTREARDACSDDGMFFIYDSTPLDDVSQWLLTLAPYERLQRLLYLDHSIVGRRYWERSLSEPHSYERDRVAIHVLSLAFCESDTDREWFISAEQTILETLLDGLTLDERRVVLERNGYACDVSFSSEDFCLFVSDQLRRAMRRAKATKACGDLKEPLRGVVERCRDLRAQRACTAFLDGQN